MESETSSPHAASPCVYPLPAAQQVYVCRRKALHALICLANSSPQSLKSFLPLLLQHVQSRIHESEQASVSPQRASQLEGREGRKDLISAEILVGE